MQDTILTIGHSTHSQQRFVELLQQQHVTAVCDVRSKPYSKINPQFNREELEKLLLTYNIAYRFLGAELGARSSDQSCYQNGKVQYDRLAKTELFQRGLKRVLRGLKENFRIVLMCAEKEPIECHRTILISRHLVSCGIKVAHIHSDGRVEGHADTLYRLATMFDLSENHMFRTREQLFADAYRLQEDRIAYNLNSEELGEKKNEVA